MVADAGMRRWERSIDENMSFFIGGCLYQGDSPIYFLLGLAEHLDEIVLVSCGDFFGDCDF